MRLLTFSLGLIVFLALSDTAYGQFNSKEYLMTIGDLVNRKGFSDQHAISPLRKLYYVQLLQPDYLWRDLAAMIGPGTEASYEDAWLFIDNFSKGLVEKMTWSTVEPAKTPVTKIAAPQTKYMAAVAKKETPAEMRPEEKKVLATAIVNSKSTTKPVATTTDTKAVAISRPTDFLRIKSADYIEYGSVGFYHNAAIIHPSYQAEMASLATHMKQDQNIKLLIHGHCNGTEPRTIIAAGIMTTFFKVDNHDQLKTVTAKEFSELRAAYAERYLISQGISPERIQVIGEGGEKGIYAPTSAHAHYNDRIELEIVKN